MIRPGTASGGDNRQVPFPTCPVPVNERQHRGRLGRQGGAPPHQAARPRQIGGRVAAPPAAAMATAARRHAAHCWGHLLDPAGARPLDAPTRARPHERRRALAQDAAGKRGPLDRGDVVERSRGMEEAWSSAAVGRFPHPANGGRLKIEPPCLRPPVPPAGP